MEYEQDKPYVFVKPNYNPMNLRCQLNIMPRVVT